MKQNTKGTSQRCHLIGKLWALDIVNGSVVYVIVFVVSLSCDMVI